MVKMSDSVYFPEIYLEVHTEKLHYIAVWNYLPNLFILCFTSVTDIMKATVIILFI